jgi:hypothetical protein
MAKPTPPSQRPGRKDWVHRLDRMAADLNIVLLLFAIGLGTLDLTLLVAQRAAARLPQVHRVIDVNEHDMAAAMTAVP